MGKKLTTEIFKERGAELYNNKYLYDKSVYVNSNTKLIVTCPVHGDFPVLPRRHLEIKHPSGCPQCVNRPLGINTTKKTLEQFLLECDIKHNYAYLYDMVTFYPGTATSSEVNTFIMVGCKEKGHGYFRVTTFAHLYQGSGCPICMASKGEAAIAAVLISRGVEYGKEHQFPDLLTRKGKNFRFDFAVFSNGVLRFLVEFDGEQHYKDVQFKNGKSSLSWVQYSDRIKNEYCERKGIKLYRISYKDMKQIPSILGPLIDGLKT